MTLTDTNISANEIWEEVFSNGNKVVGLHLIYPKVVILLNVGSKEDLTDGTKHKMIGNLIDFSLNSIMFKSSFDKIIILDHNSNVGEGLLNPKCETYWNVW